MNDRDRFGIVADLHGGIRLTRNRGGPGRQPLSVGISGLREIRPVRRHRLRDFAICIRERPVRHVKRVERIGNFGGVERAVLRRVRAWQRVVPEIRVTLAFDVFSRACDHM